MYDKIVNPATGRKVSVYGKLGQSIIRNYITQAGGFDGPCGISKPSYRCKKSDTWDHENCELHQGRCRIKRDAPVLQEAKKFSQMSQAEKTAAVAEATKKKKRQEQQQRLQKKLEPVAPSFRKGWNMSEDEHADFLRLRKNAQERRSEKEQLWKIRMEADQERQERRRQDEGLAQLYDSDEGNKYFYDSNEGDDDMLDLYLEEAEKAASPADIEAVNTHIKEKFADDYVKVNNMPDSPEKVEAHALLEQSKKQYRLQHLDDLQMQREKETK